MNIEQILEANLKLTLSMEWYGICIEETKEVDNATYNYVSVPESSTIEVADPKLNAQIKTADGLAKLAKDMLIKIQLDTCTAIDDDEDFIQYVKDTVSDWIKVYAKIRKGEVWTKEMGDARVKEIVAQVKQAKEYKEV